MTPQEAWSGYKPSVAHLRIFGCVAYSQVPKSKRKKLDDRGEKCIFLRYSEESKAYKIYNPLTKKLVVSRDIIFDEERVWSWSDEEKAKEQQLVEEPKELSTEALQSTPPSSQPTTLSPVHRTLHLIWEIAAADPPQIKVQLRGEVLGKSMSKQKMERLIFSAYMLIMSLLPFKKLLKKIVGDPQRTRRYMLFKRMTLES